MAFEIYLNFKDGQALPAMERYEEVFGGQRTMDVMYYKDGPGMNVKPEEENYVLHSELNIAGFTLNFSDVGASYEYLRGTSVSVLYTCESVEDLKNKFRLLSVGGQVSAKPGKTFYAESYTAFVDEFGIPWELIYIQR